MPSIGFMPALGSCLHRPSSVRPLLARVAAEVRPPTGLVELISHVLMRADAIVAYTCEVHQAYNPAACGETQRARQARANLGRGVHHPIPNSRHLSKRQARDLSLDRDTACGLPRRSRLRQCYFHTSGRAPCAISSTSMQATSLQRRAPTCLTT